MIFSLICAIIQIILWWLYKYDVIKFIKIISEKIRNFINKVLKFLIDIIPFILMISYHTKIAVIFLIGCYISDKMLSVKFSIGMILFLITYGMASIYVVKCYPINYEYIALSFLLMIVMCFILLPIWNENLLFKIGCVFYGFTALVLCFYTFLHSKNLGFLFLVIGDLSLILTKIINQKNFNYGKLSHAISNSFYYAGLSFVSLSLI